MINCKPIFVLCVILSVTCAQNYRIVDTAQEKCFNNSNEITTPSSGAAFFGQDAQYDGNQPNYTISNDGLTVYDNVTGLTWTKSHDWNGDGDLNINDKMNQSDAVAYAATLNSANYGGFNDWRLPNIKELYSLINFMGTDPDVNSTESNITPFIDYTIFDIGPGDISAGERIIDGQFATTTLYVVSEPAESMFGVNLIDGRIKGYHNPQANTYYAYYCRGNIEYGVNDFVDNGDGTITDNATGLMWSQNDNGEGLDWENALAYAEGSEHAGYTDWRLPNAKELQSIIDYTRSPDTHGSAAIDPIFSSTQITNMAGESDYPWYWTGTTHLRANGSASAGVYICFGRGLGSMDGSTVVDIHGAGCQRSDPKFGNPNDYPVISSGPQGDVQRVFNYVRLVRDDSINVSVDNDDSIPLGFQLAQNYPNPFNPSTTIKFSIPNESAVKLEIYNMNGQLLETVIDKNLANGNYEFDWHAVNIPSGTYYYKLSTNTFSQTKQMTLIK